MTASRRALQLAARADAQREREQPNSVHNVVMRIGRRRPAARGSRLRAARPAARILSRVEVEQNDVRSHDQPDQQIRPMNDETFERRTGHDQQQQPAYERQRATGSTNERLHDDSNCTSITAQTLTTASPSTSSSAWNAYLLLAYWPPSPPARGRRAALASNAAHVAITPPSERRSRRAVRAIICCWFSRSSPPRSAGVNVARLRAGSRPVRAPETAGSAAAGGRTGPSRVPAPAPRPGRPRPESSRVHASSAPLTAVPTSTGVIPCGPPRSR